MLRKFDFVNMGIAIFVGFACWSANRLYANIDQNLSDINSKMSLQMQKIEEGNINYVSLKGQVERRLGRLEYILDREHPQAPLSQNACCIDEVLAQVKNQPITGRIR